MSKMNLRMISQMPYTKLRRKKKVREIVKKRLATDSWMMKRFQVKRKKKNLNLMKRENLTNKVKSRNPSQKSRSTRSRN
jgi:ABC-type glutathione transport system ATPase component